MHDQPSTPFSGYYTQTGLTRVCHGRLLLCAEEHSRKYELQTNGEVDQAAITRLNTGIQANQWQQSIILLFSNPLPLTKSFFSPFLLFEGGKKNQRKIDLRFSRCGLYCPAVCEKETTRVGGEVKHGACVTR